MNVAKAYKYRICSNVNQKKCFSKVLGGIIFLYKTKKCIVVLRV